MTTPKEDLLRAAARLERSITITTLFRCAGLLREENGKTVGIECGSSEADRTFFSVHDMIQHWKFKGHYRWQMFHVIEKKYDSEMFELPKPGEHP